MKTLKWRGWCLAGAVFCQILAGRAEMATYRNPVIPGDHPDPSIIRAGREYWATATSSEWGPVFPLLRSTDLLNWQPAGAVFRQKPEWASGNFWAPEISEYNGHYYVYYTGRKNGGPLAVAVADAESPGGPYTDHGPLVAQADGSIDPVPCTDEKGERYLVWKEDGNSVRQKTPIWAQRLDASGTKLIGEKKELIHNDTDWEGGVVEGPYVLRRGDWFYLFYSGNACCGPECTYAMGVARSKSLLGPWKKNPANPILVANAQWKCPGHGSIVSDESGRYWLLYHAYAAHSSVFTGREGMLDEVVFGANGWPTINNNQGPSVEAISPVSAGSRRGAVQLNDHLSFYDDFSEGKLKPGWQWPLRLQPTLQFKDGHVVISNPERHRNNEDSFVAVLAHACTSGDYVATAIVKPMENHTNTSAGLAAFGDGREALGLEVQAGEIVLWRRDRGAFTRLAHVKAPVAPEISLRMIASEGFHYQFSYSSDGKVWTPVGNNESGRNLPPWDRAVRVALTVSGENGAEAEFVSFRLEPDPAP